MCQKDIYSQQFPHYTRKPVRTKNKALTALLFGAATKPFSCCGFHLGTKQLADHSTSYTSIPAGNTHRNRARRQDISCCVGNGSSYVTKTHLVHREITAIS